MLKSKSLALFIICLVTFNAAAALAETTYTATGAGEHAIELTNGTKTYSNPTVTKTGDVSGQNDDYDWKGTNAAVLASGGAVLTINGGSITSNASYGNAVFSYGGNNSNTNNNNGDGTTINISDATIITTKNNSGGIMTTGGGIMNASNLTITTSGGSSAAIRSDSGGGTVTVTGGTYTAGGQGSPAIYSTADITVSNATLNSGVAQGVVIEGGNSVTLKSSDVKANHTKKNGQDSTYQAILIYKSMSKDASSGKSSFKMTGGSITNAQGDIFCITNTSCNIDLENVTIANNDSSGNFLRAEGQSWGNSGSNGGTVTLTAANQDIAGNILVDSSSSVTMTLKEGSTFKGAVNPDSSNSVQTSAAAGDVDIAIEKGAKLTLTENSYVSSLTTAYTNDIDYGNYSINVSGKSYNNSNPLEGTLGEKDDSFDDDDDNDNDNENGDDNNGNVKTSSSSGGCNIGYMNLAVLACAAFFSKKK
ncbi:MAG: hypothetical protein IJ859_00015 [Synergistaceae bacterium]|nr:hypothetical protein [Synergistaceae bacterium]